MTSRLFLASICAVILAAFGCGSNESDILKHITDASNEGTVIDFRPIAQGDWERLLVFRPYTTKAVIENRIGSPWSDYDKSTVSSSLDNVCLLVFVRGNDVVASALVPRNLADFHLAGFHEVPEIPRERAVFEFTGKEKLVELVSSLDTGN